ncbi:hypothetical protein BpOF4_18310 [Alkalihalophilus pseudofirmus OF4]|uniref:Uncharacterized protein n=1 Tax=Alkalihalophilus pseudofirmus (strain ATCC BAA-2126 / JCM 17055 / OF4) TaxID=398511 RepID=D3FS68_ALKPO|nr:hypothetical protein [Alkalihalophilus pseudofirmus]ADC51703.1 hypothetical protein BpOF4_18310 [Alkalihalophilus pseudofirmus OF4]
MNLFFEKRNSDVIIEADTKVMAEINGNLTVLPGAKLELTAPVQGDLILKRYSKASIGADVNGIVYDEGASLEIAKDIDIQYEKIKK